MYDAFWRVAKEQLPNASVCLNKFHVEALVKNAFEDTRRRVNKRPGASTAVGRRNRTLAKTVDAVADNDESHHKLRCAYLMLQLFDEWSTTGLRVRRGVPRGAFQLDKPG